MTAPFLVFVGFCCWMNLMTVITAQQQQQNRKRRKMGPRIRISEPEFLKFAEKERSLIIQGPKGDFDASPWTPKSRYRILHKLGGQTDGR
jgi:hypothetical protein